MNTQLSLLDYKPSNSESLLSTALKGRGWVKARDLMPIVNLNDRELRQEAEAAAGEIVTGNKGYCCLEECSVDELTSAANRLESQAKKMLARSVSLRNRAIKRVAA